MPKVTLSGPPVPRPIDGNSSRYEVACLDIHGSLDDVAYRSRRVNSSPKEALSAFTPGVRKTCRNHLTEASRDGMLGDYRYAHDVNR